MIDLSFSGLVGAIAGTIAAAVVYGTLIDFIERRVVARKPAAADRSTQQQELALLRRGILAFDVLLLGGLGYWIGDTIGG